MESSFVDLVNIRRMRNIKRCNNFPVLIQEDVAQHSYYVTMLAWNIASEYNDNVASYNMRKHPYDDTALPRVDVDQVIMKALCHDIPECVTSDILFNVKHSSSEMSEMINKLEEDIVSDMCGDFFESIANYITNAKACLNGEFVAIADLLELAIYCAEEINMGNNSLYYMLDKCCVLLQDFEEFELLYYKNFSPTFVDCFNVLKQTLNKVDIINDPFNLHIKND